MHLWFSTCEDRFHGIPDVPRQSSKGLCPLLSCFSRESLWLTVTLIIATLSVVAFGLPTVPELSGLQEMDGLVVGKFLPFLAFLSSFVNGFSTKHAGLYFGE